MNHPRSLALTTALALGLAASPVATLTVTGQDSASSAPSPQPPDFSALLRNALFEEEASRDLEKAAAGYEAVLAAHEKQRQLAATALYRLAEVRRKQGRNDDAAALYQRLLAEFPAADPLTRLSRENLTAMGESAPDSPNPASPAAAGISKEEADELVRLASLAKNSPDLLNAPQGEGQQTPLVQASRMGWVKAATYLLDAGVPAKALKPDSEPFFIRTNPLAMAANGGHLTICELLLSRGAPANDAVSQLPDLISRKMMAVFDLLVAKGVDLDVPGTQGDFYTPLAQAAKEGDTALMEKLLKAGAKPDAPFSAGITPLIIAAGEGHAAAVELLLAAGASTKSVTRRLDNGRQNVPGSRSALQTAVAAGSVECVRALLKAGADPNAEDDDKKRPVDFWNNESTALEILTILFDAGAAADSRGLANLLQRDEREDALTPLVDLFLARGADPTETINDSPVPVYNYAKRKKVTANLFRRYAHPKLMLEDKVSLSFPEVATSFPLTAKSADTQAPPSLGKLLLEWDPSPPGGNRTNYSSQPLDWAHLTLHRRAGENAASATVEIDLSKREPLPALAWGDIVEIRTKADTAPERLLIQNNGGFDMALPSEIKASLRASQTVPLVIKVPDFDGPLTLRGALVTFDPTRPEAPIASPAGLLSLLGASTNGLGKEDVTLTRSPESGGGTLTGDLMLRNLSNAELRAGDRLEVKPPAEPTPRSRTGVLLTCPGYPVRWLRELRAAGETPANPYSYTAPTLLQFLASFYAPIDFQKITPESEMAKGDEDAEEIAFALSQWNYVHDRPVPPHPDWSGVRIRRMKADGAEEIIDPALDEAMAQVTAETPRGEAAKRDMPLLPGDIVELPLRKDKPETPWTGFDEAAARLFTKALSLRATIVDGSAFQEMDFTYVPPRFVRTSGGLLPLPAAPFTEGRFSDPLQSEAARSLGRKLAETTGQPQYLVSGSLDYLEPGAQLMLQDVAQNTGGVVRRQVVLPGQIQPPRPGVPGVAPQAIRPGSAPQQQPSAPRKRVVLPAPGN